MLDSYSHSSPFRSILFPSRTFFFFYRPEYRRGLELLLTSDLVLFVTHSFPGRLQRVLKGVMTVFVVRCGNISVRNISLSFRCREFGGVFYMHAAKEQLQQKH